MNSDEHRSDFAILENLPPASNLTSLMQKLDSSLGGHINVLASVLLLLKNGSDHKFWIVSEPQKLGNVFSEHLSSLFGDEYLNEALWMPISEFERKYSIKPEIEGGDSAIIWPVHSTGITAVAIFFIRGFVRTDLDLASYLAPLENEMLGVLIKTLVSEQAIELPPWKQGRRLQGETDQRITQTIKAVHKINHLIIREKDKHKLLQAVCYHLENLGYLQRAILMEVSESGTVQEIYSVKSLPQVEKLTDSRFIQWAKTLIDSQKDFLPIKAPISGFLGLGKKPAFAFPIRYEQYTLGLLVLANTTSDKFSTSEFSLYKELATDLGYALHNLELEDENRRISESIRFINKEVEGNNSQEILDALVANIAKVLSADVSFVGQLIGTGDDRKIRVVSSFGGAYSFVGSEFALKGPACRQLINEGICALEKGSGLEFLKTLAPEWKAMKGCVGVALRGDNNRTIGVLVVLSRNRIINLRMMRHVIQVFAHRAGVELFRLQFEKKLKESEKRYRDIFENSPFGIYRTTLDGKVLIANPALLHMLGYGSVDELRTLSLTRDIYRDAGDRKKFLDKISKNPGFVIFDSVFTRKDGSPLYVRQKATALRDTEGKILYIEGTVEDITEQKEQEERIRYQNRLLEFASDAIIGTDGDYVIRFWNKSAEKLYGWKTEEVLGKKIEQVVKMDIPFEKRLEIRKLARAKGYWRGEVVQYNRRGEKLYVEMSVSDLRDENGKLIASVGINRDISEKIKYEKALKASEESYRGLFDSVMEAIYIQAQDGTFLDVNEGAVRMYGYPKAYLIGKNPADVAAPGRNDMEKVMEQFKKALQGEPQQFEFWGKRSNGEEFPKKVRLYKGKYFGQDVVIALAEDISEKKRIEEEKKNLERQLHQSQRLETIGTLAGGIAHDFNNILTPILGYAEMIKMSLKGDVRLRNKVEQIIKASLRARDLIQQILTFSRQIDQQLKPVFLQHIINESTHLLRASIPSTIKLKKEIDKSCLPVMADPAQIHQVLLNLCTNAYHAMEKNGGELFIGLRQVTIDEPTAKLHPTLKPGLYNQIIVADTGEGMEPAVIERIFEPFFTTKEVGKGTGLGLSVVHGIITNYHGEITVYSEKGKGTVFHVYLPVADIQKIEEIKKQEKIPHGTENILIVDDEPGVLQLEEQMLEYFGYKPYGLTESTKVLDELNRHPDRYKMLITDLTMPNLTGMQLAKMVRQHFPDLPIIMITGYSEELTSDIKEKYGIQAILMKPVVASDLASTVRKILDSRTQKEG